MLRFKPGRRPPRDPEADFHAFHYLRHNARRLEHLASLNLDIHKKNVLETGAGIGDHTSFFTDRGCRVLATDARPENVEKLERNFRGDLAVSARVLDLDNPEPLPEGALFEIVYCYGTLYHLAKPAEAIAFLADYCGGMMLLETSVSFGEDESVNLVPEDPRWFSQSATGQGCRPTRGWVVARLREHFPHVYLPLTQPNHPEFPLDWRRPASSSPAERSAVEHVRAVFIASRRPIDNPLLTAEIPELQRRH